MIELNTCLNQEAKFYSLSLGGVIAAGICFILGVLLWSIIPGAICGILGYLLGSKIATAWHVGIIQKFLYWHLPVSKLFGKNCPPSSHRHFK